MEHETFLTLLQDPAHWEFEIFLTILQDVVLGLLIWPFVSKHWKHHIARDEKEDWESQNLSFKKSEVPALMAKQVGLAPSFKATHRKRHAKN